MARAAGEGIKAGAAFADPDPRKARHPDLGGSAGRLLPGRPTLPPAQDSGESYDQQQGEDKKIRINDDGLGVVSSHLAIPAEQQSIDTVIPDNLADNLVRAVEGIRDHVP